MAVSRLFRALPNYGTPELDDIQGSIEETHPYDEVLRTFRSIPLLGKQIFM
jgi:hypothetical protein